MMAPVLADVDPVLESLHKRSSFSINNGFGIQPKIYKKTTDKGTVLAMEGVAVFRTGTFRDSMGYQNTWESIHLNQMVTNYEYLKGNGTFANVPVRDGHPGWLINGTPGTGKVVGWHTGLKVATLTAPHDGTEYDYLLADYEILDASAQGDINSGLWVNRSSEIGGYTTNAEAEHWPVYMGVAYVDIPAVEGLNFTASRPGGEAPRVYVMFDNSKEKDVTAPVLAVPAVTAGAPAVTPQVPVAGTQHGAPAAATQPFVFSVNGANTSDFAAVQAHITGLEKFQSETQEANRKGFVTALCAANKLPVTKKDSYEKFALGLAPDQYTAWVATFDDVEVPALLGQHGLDGGVANGGLPTVAANAATGTAAEIVQLKEQVGMHKRAGTPKKAIEGMASYVKLKSLDPTFTL